MLSSISAHTPSQGELDAEQHKRAYEARLLQAQAETAGLRAQYDQVGGAGPAAAGDAASFFRMRSSWFSYLLVP